MSFIKVHPGWHLPEREATPEEIYVNRRSFLKTMGYSGVGAWGLLMGALNTSCEAVPGGGEDEVLRTIPKPAAPYSASRNPRYQVERSLTQEKVAAAYNNFYEFTTDKDRVWRLAEKFETRPWQVEVTGHVHKPRIFDLDDLLRSFELEERVYRFRCVEAWSMVVPWVGFPLKKLIDAVQPTSRARYIRMLTFLRPEQAYGQKTQSWYAWPYYEGLTLQEGYNELALLAMGIYGHALPNQHGAPVRLVLPWKYGYKSIKSVVQIEFVEQQPPTFWNDLTPSEYSFTSNVNPGVPHPRWSQATERVIDTGQRIPTRLYNGYGDYVADMYTRG